jgi:hypothetical protein
MIYHSETSRVFLKAVGSLPDHFSDYTVSRGLAQWKSPLAFGCLSLARSKAAQKEARLQAAFFGCGVPAHVAS